jgi:uncharacterized protein YbbK (DUF523 family)
MSRRFNENRFINPASANQRAAVAVSACLAGERVRYDGADKLLPALDRVTLELNLIAMCPEVGAGMTVPRPPVHLVEQNGFVRALGRDDRTLDVTGLLQTFAQQSLNQVVAQHALCGYLWKSRSPSCGFHSTPVFDMAGSRIGQRSGIQAAHFQQALPWLCYAEETDLHDEVAIDSFVLRCRLVSDVMHGGASLAQVYQHYRFLIERFAEEAQRQLAAHSEKGSRENFMTALQHQCGHIEREELLRLFSA